MDQIRRVPFLDLQSQIGPIREELFQVIQEAINANDFVLGPRLNAFEDAFAAYCGTEHAVGVNSGTDALFLTLRALGIGPGDEVITVPNVFIAPVEAIAMTGATPVLVDVEEDTYLMDPEALAGAITGRTKAVMPVHLFGTICNMDAILDLAKKHDLHVIEDACQAHGAKRNGKRAGSFGRAAAFSFYPTKNLSAFGDGGAITTNDSELAAKLKSLRHHAQGDKNDHSGIGYNSRLDSVQAAVLNTKLHHLDRWNQRRRDIVDRYKAGLKDTEYRFQRIYPDTESVHHVLAVRHPLRDAVHECLDQANVGWGKHIARSIHRQSGYAFLGYRDDAFPISEKLCDELVSLPVCPSLSDDDIDYVVDALVKVGVSV